MDFLDDEAGVSENESVLVPNSQAQDGERPRKLRRVIGDGDDSDYDLPAHDYDKHEYVDVDNLQYRSRYEDVMHVVQHAGTQRDTFVSQLTQPWSSPTRIRGPRWVKRTTPPPKVSRLGKESDKPPSATNGQLPMTHGPPAHLTEPSAPLKPDDEFDDDDPALLDAFLSSPVEDVHSVRQPNADEMTAARPHNIRQASRHSPTSMRQTTLFGTNTTQRALSSTQMARAHNWPLASRHEPPTHHKIDIEAMKTWTYPVNLGKIRDYQYNIVHKSLFSNILVALPTGLGKTFIAATVMLNWYRWTKDAQIVFVAPTKPLVSQQEEACYYIAGIPRSQATVLTGEVNSAVRAEDWEECRVFFMTPQTLMNDLESGRADPKRIVLLVVDEAHKATGSYAYVQVVKVLRKYNSSFRVLALTATPGGTVEAVQKVIDGLDIARVEIRTEDSIDIRGFVHPRDTQLEVFDNSDELSTALELFAAAVGPLLNQLTSQNAYWGRDPTAITLYGLRMAHMDWKKSEAGRKASPATQRWIFNMFQPLMSLAHNLELLKFHGIGPFFNKMKCFENESYGMGKFAKEIVENQHYKKLMNYMRAWVNNPEFVGHPKLEYLKQVVLNHFMDAGEGQISASGRAPSDTRIMIFAHYRDSAEEIVRVLKRHGPMIRPHVFVGQSGTKGSEGMDQKTQVQMLEKFKAGTYNTLVATSIGEEGLDIGEVDLIICYDSSKSPIRMLQRMGRTGRKRAGTIVVLLMRGKEENDYHRAKDNYQKMQEIIESGRDFTFHDDRSPRIVPKEIIPVVDKRIVDIPTENTQARAQDPSRRKPKHKGKKPPKKFHMPDGVQTGIMFLGAGGKKSKTKKGVAEPVLDVFEAPLPPLEQVVLTAEEQSQLEENYQQIAGDEPQYIDPIRFDAEPEYQRKLGRVARVKHSKTTKALVSALTGMREQHKDWTRPTADVMHRFDLMPVIHLATPEDGQPLQRYGPAKPKHQSPRTSIALDSSDALRSAEYDDADSFINDASDKDESPATSPDIPALLKPVKKTSDVAEQPFWVSQKTIQDASTSDEDEIPDLANLVGGNTAARHPSKSSEASKIGQGSSKRWAARRIIDSDEEE